MEGIVNVVGALVAALCATMLLRAYFKVRKRLLLWSGLCFVGLTVSNVLVIVDLQILPTSLDLYPHRLAIGAIAMLVLVFGLVWDSE
jgi:hypothetical protein